LYGRLIAANAAMKMDEMKAEPKNVLSALKQLGQSSLPCELILATLPDDSAPPGGIAGQLTLDCSVKPRA
jgi:hypothetical protein